MLVSLVPTLIIVWQKILLFDLESKQASQQGYISPEQHARIQHANVRELFYFTRDN